MPPRLLHPVQDAARTLAISRATIYRLIDNGDIHVVKIGSRTYITTTELERYVASLERGNN